MEDPDLTCARLFGLFRCTLSTGGEHEVALVRLLERSNWKPVTKWDGCRVYEEPRKYTFILPQYLIRGVHMVPAFDGPKDHKSRVYLNDLTDGDIFLRAGN